MTGPICIVCSKEAAIKCSACSPDVLIYYCSNNCQKNHWPQHKSTCRSQPTEVPLTEEQVAEHALQDLKYYILQVFKITRPVLICIILSVFWVKVTNPEPEYYIQTTKIQLPTPSNTIPIPKGGASTIPPTPQEFWQSLQPALIILAQIIGVTILILILFKLKCFKVLKAIFTMLVAVLLGFFTYLIGFQLLVVFNVALDWITFIFIIYNIVGAGLVAIFYKGPLIVQQTFLIFMSSLMAYSLTTTAELTTWIILGLLVVWDLVAVLCPFGPLKLLIQSSRQQNVQLPALLFSTMAYEDSSVNPDDIELRHLSIPSPTRQLNEEDDEDDEVEERGGLKLGLGDFVFYSVLVARGALFDWTTTISCIVAVLTGMNLTIFLLAVYRKALPALPISISFGILFYFLASRMVTPYLNSLIILPDLKGVSGLQIGKRGGGMIYI